MKEIERAQLGVEDKDYKGKRLDPYQDLGQVPIKRPIYLEHDEAYLQEFIDNLRAKGVHIAPKVLYFL